jgi:hypothetical protein
MIFLRPCQVIIAGAMSFWIARDDIQISTLQRLIQALGGRLELIAHMPGGDIRISQFKTQP